MKRNLFALLISLLLAAGYLAARYGPAISQKERAPRWNVSCPNTDEPKVSLISPEMVEFHWARVECSLGYSFKYWEYYKGTSPDKMESAYMSLDPLKTDFRDEDVSPGQTYYYQFKGICASPAAGGGSTLRQPLAPADDPVPFPVPIGDAWCGAEYKDLNIAGDFVLKSLEVKAGGS